MHVRKIPSRVRSGALATVYLLVAGEMALAQPAGTSSTAELVRVMTDVTREWEVRHEAEERLLAGPSFDVLHGLLPLVEQGKPAVTIWNSRGRIYDREGTVVWQVYYAVDRTWSHHVRALGTASAGRVLSGLLERATTDPARIRVLDDLARYWIDEADSLVAALAAGPYGFEVRRSAALCLLLHSRETRYDGLVEAAEGAPGDERKAWFDLLSDPAHVPREAVDSRVVVIGFGLLEDEVDRTGDASDLAVALTARLAAYLDQDFGTGLGDRGIDADVEVSRNAVWRALEWWMSNQGRFRLESQLRRRGESGGS